MGNSPKFVYECPNVENTLPLDLYRAQSPASYSQADGDKLVLYAGNNDCLLQVPAHENVKIHDTLKGAGPEMVVFIVDTNVMLWFPKTREGSGTHQEFGVELPYPSIALHALKDVGGEIVLYLQVLSCDIFKNTTLSDFTQTVELVVRVNGETSSSPVWNSPLLRKNNTVSQIYDALSECSALHCDASKSDVEDDFWTDHEWNTADSTSIPQIEIEMPAGWVNSGNADDLGVDNSVDEVLGGEAGMNVTVEYVTVAGVVRRRASMEEEANKHMYLFEAKKRKCQATSHWKGE